MSLLEKSVHHELITRLSRKISDKSEYTFDFIKERLTKQYEAKEITFSDLYYWDGNITKKEMGT